MTTPELDARYGRTPERRFRRRIVAIAAAVSTAIVLIAWVVWAGLLSPGATLESRDVGFEVLADDAVLVRFEVTVSPGSSVTCALEVQNAQHAIVGWKVIDVPASDTFTRQFEELVVTSEPADVGLISVCRLT
jgi:hypothetical protein